MESCQDVNYVFHLAALKHVPVCEDQPIEALKTNVHGTQNVIDAAISCNVDRVVYISTDKASNPANFYGLSKAMGERLIIHANTLNTKTKFVCIRGGNVLGTNGSVILVFKATFESLGGEIFVMKMPTCKIIDLASVLIEASGKETIEIETLGIRPGEKIHELLLSEYESTTTVTYDDEYFVILPPIHIEGLKEYYAPYTLVNLEKYDSSKETISKEAIREMLLKGGFI